jgi:hypothetical protein
VLSRGGGAFMTISYPNGLQDPLDSKSSRQERKEELTERLGKEAAAQKMLGQYGEAILSHVKLIQLSCLY